MSDPKLELDAAASRMSVLTRAKGMLAKLAHDLSIDAREMSATASVEGDVAKVELRASSSKLEVDGVLKGAQIDRGVLSRSDRSDIERKIREEVLRSREVVVRMEAPLSSGLATGKSTLSATGTIEVGGRTARLSSRPQIDASDARITVDGRANVSLPGLGITPPKGPLGAFRVDDEVEIVYRLVFDRRA